MFWTFGTTTTVFGEAGFFHQDRLGSVVATSTASGVITPYTYGPYGEPQSWAGSRFRYTGATVIPEGVAPANTTAVIRPISDLSLRREVGLAYRQADAAAPAVARILAALDRRGRAPRKRALVGARAA